METEPTTLVEFRLRRLRRDVLTIESGSSVCPRTDASERFA